MGKPWPLLCLYVQILALPLITAARVEKIHRLCEYTRYPEECVGVLLPLQPSFVIDDVSAAAFAIVEKIKEEMTPEVSISSLETGKAIDICKELIGLSSRRLDQSLKALKLSPGENKENLQTWLSAVLTFQETCKDAADELQGPLSKPLSAKMKRLAALSSNALALINRIPKVSDNANLRNAVSEKRLSPSVSDKGHGLITSAIIKPTAVVATDGSGDFSTVADAINAAASQGGNPVIFVKAGVYNEKLRITQDDVTLIGEGMYATIISFDSSVTRGSTMPESATVVVTGDRFVAIDIGFENSAGPESRQALALRVASDRAVFFRCSVQGYQDSLYAEALRQFYRDCDITGTIDFIFGNAAAFFQNCNLIFRRPIVGAFNVMMANGRMDPGQTTGFVAQRCSIQAGSDLVPVRGSVRSYLGRPWKRYSRAVIMETLIDGFIQPEGWSEWSGGFALDTLYFAEGDNVGGGARTEGRVNWPGYHVLGAGERSHFTVSSFIQGTSWLPSTGVTFQPGL